MSRSNPDPIPVKVKSPRQPKPEAGMRVASTDLPSTIRRLENEGKKVLGMKVKRERTAVVYYLSIL